MSLRIAEIETVAPVYRPGPTIEPASAADCIAALGRLCAPGGAPRWAATGWAAALVGPFRDTPHLSDKVSRDQAALESLAARLAPTAAQEIWPTWMGADRSEALLGLGVAQGKAARTTAVDIPASASRLVVDISDQVAGVVRFTAPQWDGQPLASSGHLAALAELVRWRGAYPEQTEDILALCRWAVGYGRSAQPHDAPGRHLAAARGAGGQLAQLDPDTVAAQLLSSACGPA